MDVSSLLVTLAPILCNSVAANIRVMKDLNQINNRLKTAHDILTEKRVELEAMVQQEHKDGRSCTNQVQEWTRAAKAAEIEAASILSRIEMLDQTWRNRLLRCFGIKTWYTRYRLSKKASRNLKKINKLNKSSSGLHVIGFTPRDPVVELPSRPSTGLEAMLRQVKQYLDEKETGIIGIYGIGGVGKTTLLQKLNNGFLSPSHCFDVVIWVTVPKDFAARSIQSSIGERLGLKWEESESEENRAMKIFRALRRRTFLLLLDDVWEAVDLVNIGIPFPDEENMCKIIFTTRSMEVCSAMDAQRKMRVEFLGEDQSWELFCDKVGDGELLKSPSFHPLAQKLVAKCGGLPLALVTVGRAMANKKTEEEWIHAAEVLERSPAELRGMREIFRLLKLSYDNLRSDLLRACFCYCALFPQDYPIDKEKLIEYWIGEGFLTGFNGIDAHNEGHAIIGELKAACLLEPGDDGNIHVRLHDVLRSFALWISSEDGANRNLILAGASSELAEAPRTSAWGGRLVISLLNNKFAALPDNPCCPGLTTLLLQQNECLKKLPGQFFVDMPALRVLDLSSTGITEIPTSIGYLSELCHLDLSGTRLSELPKELGRLEKLGHLNLQKTQFLQTIPRKAILGLKKLKVLNLYYSYAGWDISDLTDEDELGFADLEHLTHLTTLGITILSSDSLKILNQHASLHSKIEFLYVQVSGTHPYLDLRSSCLLRPRRLSIKNCDAIEALQVSEEGSTSLRVLNLHSLPKLTVVWKNITPAMPELLRNLRFLNISHCDAVKNIAWAMKLPKLEEINLLCCGALSEVVGGDETLTVSDSEAFPSLRELALKNLAELNSVFPIPYLFPRLAILWVVGCPNLRKLPFGAGEGLKPLPRVFGSQQWWDGLEWDEIGDDNRRFACFQPV